MRRILHVLVAACAALILTCVAFTALPSATTDEPPLTPPPPLQVAASPLTPTPLPTASPIPAPRTLAVAIDALAHAPAGRTGIPSVDAMVDALVAADAATIAALAATAWEGIDDCTRARPRALDAAAMAAAFAAERPPLHSVITAGGAAGPAPTTAYAVVFGRGSRAGGDATTERAWKIDVAGGRIAAASSYCGFVDVVFEPPVTEIERYLLLPPAADLPPPVALHATPPTTGNDALDAIVREALAGDRVALARRVQATAFPCSAAEAPPLAAPRCAEGGASGDLVSAVAVNGCTRLRFEGREDAVQELLADLDGAAPSLHAIAAVPDGYVPAGDALVLLSWETRRYNWSAVGLVVDDDAITGLLRSCVMGRPEWLYPPAVVVGPFAGAVRGDGPTWSGIPAVDRVLVALSNGDEHRIRGQFDPVLIRCVVEPLGIGSPPVCVDGETPGELVRVLPVADCEVAYMREEAFTELATVLAQIAPRLYAVTEPPRGFADLWRLADYTLLLVDAAAGPPPASPYPTIAVSERGIAGFASGCGATLTSNLLRPSPEPAFLVAPP